MIERSELSKWDYLKCLIKTALSSQLAGQKPNLLVIELSVALADGNGLGFDLQHPLFSSQDFDQL